MKSKEIQKPARILEVARFLFFKHPDEQSASVMRILRLCVFPALSVLLMGSASSAPERATLQVKVLDAKTVVVHGRGFSQGRLLVSADMDMPHASVACYTEFTRVALVKGGEFETVLNPSKISDCDFSCGPEPFNYVVAVESLDGAALAEANFACVAPHSGAAK